MRARRQRRLPAWTAAAAAMMCLAQPGSHAAITIASDLRVPLPANACSVARAFERIATTTATIAGIELVPSACSRFAPMPPGPRGELQLQGMEVDAAFDALVQLAPVYEWRRDAGVVVVRPARAWKDPEHFLHRVLDHFTVREGTVPIALAALQTALGPWEFGNVNPGRVTENMQRTFTVEARGATAYDVMNAIVRSHGQLFWEVSYCGSDASYANATLSFTTFDGVGVGGHAIFLTYPDGTRRDPCRAAERR